MCGEFGEADALRIVFLNIATYAVNGGGLVAHALFVKAKVGVLPGELGESPDELRFGFERVAFLPEGLME